MCIFWDIAFINDCVGLSQFLGNIQTTPSSKFYGFYVVNDSLWDFFINGCTVLKCIVFYILYYFVGLGQFCRRSADLNQTDFSCFLCENNYNWFYIFKNCILYELAGILNSPAVLFHHVSEDIIDPLILLIMIFWFEMTCKKSYFHYEWIS